MNYTNEQINDALELISTICRNETCNVCPFATDGWCILRNIAPYEWQPKEREVK